MCVVLSTLTPSALEEIVSSDRAPSGSSSLASTVTSTGAPSRGMSDRDTRSSRAIGAMSGASAATLTVN